MNIQPCPCGKRLIREVHSSNYWGQTSCHETFYVQSVKKKMRRKKHSDKRDLTLPIARLP